MVPRHRPGAAAADGDRRRPCAITGAEGGGYWQGTYMLTGIDISGEDGDTLVASLTWELDDATLPAWTAAA